MHALLHMTMHIHPPTHTYTHTCIPPPTTHTTQNTPHTHIHTSMQVHAYTRAHTHTHTHTYHTHIHHKHKHTHCTDHSLWKLPRRNDDVADIRNQLVLHDAIAGGGGSQGGRCIHLQQHQRTHHVYKTLTLNSNHPHPTLHTGLKKHVHVT